jgi:tellurite resistance protein TerC
VFHRRPHAIRFGEAVAWSAVWVGLSLAFFAGVWHFYGSQKGLEFLTGYLIEEALSVDNVLIFILIFNTFRVPPHYQHRVLFWGVVGALVMRAVFIFVGAAALERFHGVLYIFAAILMFTGFRLLFASSDEHPERNPVFRLFVRVLPASTQDHGAQFFARENGRRVVTPLFLVLILIEITDLIFAVDSIPAIFAITSDPFIVFTSNIFAILGLRSLYFCLAGFIERLRYLKTGLALVLIFVAIKMFVSGFWPIPIHVSLLVVAGLIGGATVISLLATRREALAARKDEVA